MVLRRINPRTVELYGPAALLGLIVAACFLVPPLAGLPSGSTGSLLAANEGLGSSGHLLGTNALGVDMLSACLYGGQVSIEVGLGAVVAGMIVGGFIGVMAGYFGGVIDSVMSRILDTFLAFPSLILALAIAAYLGPNERDEIIAIAFYTVPAFGRLARGAARRIKQRDFIFSAWISGASRRTIITSHVVPNVIAPMFTFAVITVAVAMIVESALSFLGLGIRPPAPSWGNLIQAGQQYLATEPHIILVPSVFLFVTVLCLNLVGDSLRARWDLR
jgi:peptide/nickel transport system permease protein